MPFRAYLFDVDGVIVDSMPLHTEVWQVYLRRAGRPVRDDLAEFMHGKHNAELVTAFFGEGLAAADVVGHGAAKEALYREMMAVRLEQSLVPGVAAFLDRHGAVTKAVGSNAEAANVDFILDGAGLRRHFEVVVSGGQVEKPKPHPEIYLRAADLLGIEPKYCVVFEDSPAGVAAARASGARVVGVETHGPLEGVDFRVRDFEDPALESWLARS